MAGGRGLAVQLREKRKNSRGEPAVQLREQRRKSRGEMSGADVRLVAGLWVEDVVVCCEGGEAEVEG
jgi:hypothetical protein